MTALTIILASLVILLYVLGCFLMRGLLKEANSEHQDSKKEVSIWPYTVLVVIAELVINRNFKW